MKNYTRREFFACMAAGGSVVAGELWWPGQKLISIPKIAPVAAPTELFERNILDLVFTNQIGPCEYFLGLHTSEGAKLISPTKRAIVKGRSAKLFFPAMNEKGTVFGICDENGKVMFDFPHQLTPRLEKGWAFEADIDIGN